MPAAAQSRSMAEVRRLRVRVGGLVQGVGFRPFVYRRATALGLAGSVRNTPAGVTIEAQGDPASLAALLGAIRDEPPPGAMVARVEATSLPPTDIGGFAILPSESAGERRARIPVDLAPCLDCLAELFDPGDRRFRYPFINCTACGPRFSLVEDMPYDRARTSMRRFEMCALCRAEYEDPASRRFHAEPNACPACGPSLTLLTPDGGVAAVRDEALRLAADAIVRGRIVGVKGVGGFHLLADARDEAAVGRLRERKRRPLKPFAVMFPTLEALRAAACPTTDEEALLSGPQRPIMLVRRAPGRLAEAVGPGNPLLGALLPYSPLHQLLMSELRFPVVATSGNVSDEPITVDAADALARLGAVADLFLTHDRAIVRPVEDSVLRVVCGRPLMLRRSRGYAPVPIPVPATAPGIVAVGGHLKTTVAVTSGEGVVVWPHIGDLQTAEARSAHARAVDDIARLSGVRPRIVACDRHPDYASRRLAERRGEPLALVQHHLAHVAACLADNGARPPALGVAWDGAGLGPDGTLWGGEFLRLTAKGWNRVAHFAPFPLPGGAAAIREPRRSAFGLLFAAFGQAALEMDDLPPVAAFTRAQRRTLVSMMQRRINAPATSSVGRLFDAVSALAGLRLSAGYEGEAAAALEWAAEGCPDTDAYELPIVGAADATGLTLDWRPALDAIIRDVRAGAPPEVIAAALHAGLAGAIVAVAGRVGERRVALTGGCFQNARLTHAAVAALRAAGFEPLWHRQVPPNDGGLSLGQAAWAAWALDEEASACA